MRVSACVLGVSLGVVQVLVRVQDTRAIGNDHTCAANEDGTMTCWGSNNAGQTGVTASEYDLSKTPLSQTDGYQIRQISVGPQDTCGIFYNTGTGDLTDTQLKCWGQNFGGFGYPDADLQPWSGSLAAIDVETCSGVSCTVPKVQQVSVGANHICVLNDQQEVKCWGKNAFGQLGYGDRLYRGGE